jgi:ferredoxin-NADP reductase
MSLARLSKILEETPETKSFLFDLGSSSFTFTPGQFVTVTASITPDSRVRRAYSMASSPLETEFQLTVKRMEDGKLSTFLCDKAAVGDLFELRGPYGLFTLQEDLARAVFIAAGSGIVPFRSMWRYIAQRPLDVCVTLLYASKSLPYVIYREELAALPTPQFNIVHTFTRSNDPEWTGYTRRIDSDMLSEVIREFDDKYFYVCGPPAMCNCVVSDLKDLGVERARIKTEKYD